MSCQACIRAGLVCDALGCATWSKVMDECTCQLQRGSVALKAAKVTLDRETHAREAAEAELRETAGELEKCSACLAVERRAHTLELTEATALLERLRDCYADNEEGEDLVRDAVAFLDRDACNHDGIGLPGCSLCDPRVQSRAPAQPAAPTPEREYTWDGYALPMMPSAPEPSGQAALEGHLQSAREMRDVYHRLNTEARAEIVQLRAKVKELENEIRLWNQELDE